MALTTLTVKIPIVLNTIGLAAIAVKSFRSANFWHFMSPREKVQNELVDWLTSTKNSKWNAPYGILTGLESLPNGGKVRTVTFGMSATLDATIYIWSPKKFTVKANGPYAYNLDGREFKSLDEVIQVLTDL